MTFSVTSKAVAQCWGGELRLVGSECIQHTLNVLSRVLFPAASRRCCRYPLYRHRKRSSHQTADEVDLGSRAQSSVCGRWPGWCEKTGLRDVQEMNEMPGRQLCPSGLHFFTVFRDPPPNASCEYPENLRGSNNWFQVTELIVGKRHFVLLLRGKPLCGQKRENLLRRASDVCVRCSCWLVSSPVACDSDTWSQASREA